MAKMIETTDTHATLELTHNEAATLVAVCRNVGGPPDSKNDLNNGNKVKLYARHYINEINKELDKYYDLDSMRYTNESMYLKAIEPVYDRIIPKKPRPNNLTNWQNYLWDVYLVGSIEPINRTTAEQMILNELLALTYGEDYAISINVREVIDKFIDRHGLK